MAIEIRDIEANGMTFRCRAAGDDGEPVLLLHGFPETSHMWTHVLPQLAGAGYRWLAPDQRGYSPGARPEGVDAYGYDELTSDVYALADAFGAERFHLVGHDWGALVGWHVVARDAPRIASWTAMSVPHARGFAEAVRDDPEEEPYRQFLALGAMTGVAEQAFLANDLAIARQQAWTSSSPEELEEYVRVFSQPGALTAALNWYRASRSHERALEDGVFGDVHVPSLLIWGQEDPYVRKMSVDLAQRYMKGEYRVLPLPAGHWLAQDKTAEVADAIIGHLRAHPIG